MAVSYKTAADRDAGRRTRIAAGRAVLADPLELLLAGISIFAGILLLVTYVGVTRVPHAEPPLAGVLNLNSSPTAERLGAVLDQAFPLAADRRIAQQQLMSFLTNADGSRRLLPNVCAIARARVPSALIDRSPSAAAFRERLAVEREHAKSPG